MESRTWGSKAARQVDQVPLGPQRAGRFSRTIQHVLHMLRCKQAAPGIEYSIAHKMHKADWQVLHDKLHIAYARMALAAQMVQTAAQMVQTAAWMPSARQRTVAPLRPMARKARVMARKAQAAARTAAAADALPGSAAA